MAKNNSKPVSSFFELPGMSVKNFAAPFKKMPGAFISNMDTSDVDSIFNAVFNDAIFNLDRDRIMGSDAIESIGYDPIDNRSGICEVEFKTMGVYQFKCNKAVYDRLKNADKPGSYFNTFIRDNFDVQKIQGAKSQPKKKYMGDVQSSTLSRIGYNPENSDLYVEFSNKGTFVYHNVPPEIYKDFQNAQSKGKYYNANIKGNKAYPSEKLRHANTKHPNEKAKDIFKKELEKVGSKNPEAELNYLMEQFQKAKRQAMRQGDSNGELDGAELKQAIREIIDEYESTKGESMTLEDRVHKLYGKNNQ